MGRGILRVLVGKTDGKETLGRPRHRWEDNIKCILRKRNLLHGLDQGGRHL